MEKDQLLLKKDESSVNECVLTSTMTETICAAVDRLEPTSMALSFYYLLVYWMRTGQTVSSVRGRWISDGWDVIITYSLTSRPSSMRVGDSR